MATTTLVTFLLRTPSPVRTVDLLGSWDNFKEAYPLQRDRQAGPGHWRGCHTFKNITCDGHDFDISKSRDGGLRMGGIYWYFYRLDDNLEQYDPAEPSTTACPLLPGQQVNIIEVPIQDEQNQHSYTLLDSMVFTLDPKAKYTPPKLLVPRDIVSESSRRRHAVPVTSLTVDGNCQAPYASRCSTASTATLQPLRRTRPTTSQGPCMTFPKASGLMAMFHRMRGTRSAPSTGNSQGRECSTSSRSHGETEECIVRPCHGPFTDLKASRVRAPLNTPEWPLAPTHIEHVAPWTADSSIDRSAAVNASLATSSYQPTEQVSQIASQPRFSEGSSSRLNDGHGVRSLQTSRRSASSSCDTYLDQPSVRPVSTAALSSTVACNNTMKGRDPEEQSTLSRSRIGGNCLDAVCRESSPLVLPIQLNAPFSEILPVEETTATHSTGLKRPTRPPSLLYDDRRTLETFYAASSSYVSQLSPHYLSQPDSPSVRDFEEAWDSESQTRAGSQDLFREDPPLLDNDNSVPTLELLQTPQFPSPGFQGYSLPEQDCGSTLTLRKPASATTPAQELSDNDHLVQSWNDGSGHSHVATLDELVDDVGYLGQAII